MTLKGGFAGDTGTGFDVRAKGVTIRGFVIEGFDVGIQLNLQDKDLDIDDSKDFTATNNTIKKNKVGIKSYNSLPGVVINYNVFEDNDYAIENDEGKGGSQYVDARYNYWGCDDGPYVEVIFEEETTTCIDWNKKGECVQYQTTKVSRFYQYVAGTPPDKEDYLTTLDPDCEKIIGEKVEHWNHPAFDWSPYKVILGGEGEAPECGNEKLDEGEECDGDLALRMAKPAATTARSL